MQPLDLAELARLQHTGEEEVPPVDFFADEEVKDAIFQTARSPGPSSRDVLTSPYAMGYVLTRGFDVQAAHLEQIDELWRRTETERVLAIVAVPPQHGKALADSTPIACLDRSGVIGWKRHGDLQIGDQVFGPDGNPTPVVWVGPAIGGEYYQCSQFRAPGVGVFAHGEHEWSLKIGRDPEFTTMETSALFDFQEDHWEWPQLPAIEPLQLPDRMLPIDPWVYGYWLALGSADGSDIQIHPTIQGEVEGYLAEAGYTDIFDRPAYKKKKVGAKFLHRHSDLLRRQLEALGATRLLTRQKRLHPDYMWSSESQRRAVLQGYVDAKSNFSQDGRIRPEFEAESLAVDFRALAVSLAYRPGEAKCYQRKNEVPYWEFSIYGTGCARTWRRARYLRDPVPYGRGNHQNANRYLHVEKAGEKTGRCIQVGRPDGLYLAGYDFLPTHNSTRLSQRGVAWALRRRPNLRIVIVSHAFSLARSFSRFTRNAIDEHPWAFGGLKLSSDRRASHDFEIEEYKGGVYAVGVTGNLTGRPADILVLDDLLSDPMQASNLEYKDRIWEWVHQVAFARLAPGASVLVVNTRWATDDPAGRILAEQPLGDWQHLRLPAIAEDNDPLGRMEGEALWPWRYDLEYLLQRQKDMGPDGFASQYQGRPVQAGGSKFTEKDTRYWRPTSKSNMVEIQTETGGWETALIVAKFSTMDFAAGLKKKNDWTVISTWGVTPTAKLIWLGMRRERTEDHAQMMQNEHAAFGGSHIVWAEPTGMQLATINTARNKGIPVIEAPGSDLDKLIRSDPARAMWIAHRIFVPADAPWKGVALDEVVNFPNAAHDDIVDTLSYAGQVISTGRVSFGNSISTASKGTTDRIQSRADSALNSRKR